MPVSLFAERYLDILEMDDGQQLDVVKLVGICPFLDRRTGECGCRGFKPVLCEIYPITFSVERAGVRFAIDDACALARVDELREHFLGDGVAAMSRLGVPVDWYRYVQAYDHVHFDYAAIEAGRRSRDSCEVFRISELIAQTDSPATDTGR